ncbi:MAG: glycosyltransferase family 39 protein [Bacteroidia bacterium]|nr:glycosyltransferase family 39 protein [Bacteroidia bacterium]
MIDKQPPVPVKNPFGLITGDFFFFLILTVTGFPLFLSAAPLLDWDEINFAECAREMIESDNYLQVQINYQPFFEKPPLFIWLQCLSMKIFGINEFGARFPNALTGILTILTLYLTGTQLKGRLFGRILACLYLCSLLPVIYFKSGIIDPSFNFLIFLAIYRIYHFETFERNNQTEGFSPWITGIWLGLAVMTKGPAAILITGLSYFIFSVWVNKHRFAWGFIGKMLLSMLITVSLWYGAETMAHGSTFLENFIRYQWELLTQPVAGHEQPFYYHFLVFTLGCFPMSVFVYRGMMTQYNQREDQYLKKIMFVWFWVVMIIFSISKTKIVHYSSMLYFPAAFISALYIENLIRNQEKIKWDSFFIYITGILLWGVAPSCINLIINHLDLIIPYIKDPVARGNLTMDVQWSGFEWLAGTLFLIGLIINAGHLVQRRFISFLYLQVALTLFFVNAQYKIMLPGIARYTQGSAQDFFEAQAGKDVYLVTGRYKSYLHLFYGKVKPHTNPNAYREDWLVNGDPDKPVYLATKNILLTPEYESQLSLFRKKNEKGGFIFFERGN